MNAFLIFTRFIHQIGLAVWIGGMLMIGAIVAPVAFHQAGLDKIQAGNVVGRSLARFNGACAVAGVALFVAEAIEWRILDGRSLKRRRRAGMRFACLLGMTALAAYLGAGLMPEMIRERAAGEMSRFDAGHRLYEALSQVQFYLALGSAYLTASLSVIASSGDSNERAKDASIREATERARI